MIATFGHIMCLVHTWYWYDIYIIFKG